MIYQLMWRDPKTKAVCGKGIVHSWDDKAVDTTDALRFLRGKRLHFMRAFADRYGARVLVRSSPDDDWKVLRKFSKPGVRA